MIRVRAPGRRLAAARSLVVLLVVLTVLTDIGSPLTAPVGASPTGPSPGTALCPPAPTRPTFRDVPASHPHAAAVECLRGLAALDEPAGSRFRPDAPATRAEFTAVLHGVTARAGVAPPATGTRPFEDVARAHPAHDRIVALAGAGIVRGTTTTTFGPDRHVDRGQMASLLARSHERLLGAPLPPGPGFRDVGGSAHEDAIRRLVGAGIAHGYRDGTYRPGAAMTRGQMASFLARFAGVLVHDAGPRVAGPTGLWTRRVSFPTRTVVEDAQGRWVATFTDGARTVALAGPGRRFTEPTAAHGVTSTTWVRLLPTPFAGRIDAAWLARARADRSPDVLAVATEYLSGAPDVIGADGRLVAGDASYGPLQPDGSRPIGSDWHDFRGEDAWYGGTRYPARPERLRSVDCSGFVRLVLGFRFDVALGRTPDGGRTLPRRSLHQAAEAPGVTPYPASGRQLTDTAQLQPGDLVFFDATTDPGGEIDHVGIYLGVDDAGRHRFVSSRRTIDGPTMGDVGGASLLDGSGLYARSFRSTRRL